jgi:hypothetical protein
MCDVDIVQVTYSSDYFPELYDFALQLIKSGHAYVDHQTPDEIKEFRCLLYCTSKLISPGCCGFAAQQFAIMGGCMHAGRGGSPAHGGNVLLRSRSNCSTT